MLDVGAVLPKLSVNDESGAAVKLAGLDRPLIVYFFPRADTPG